MPKMKTKKAVLKRFHISASGKLKFKKPGLRHILTKKSADVKRQKKAPQYIKSCDMGRLMDCLPNHFVS